MRILFLCNIPFALNSGGHQRLSHLLKGLAAAGEVTLVYPITGRDIGPDLEALRPLCKQVYTFSFESLAYQRDYRLPRPLHWATHKLRFLHPATPASIQQLKSTEAMTLVAQLSSESFDLVWGQRISSLWMLPPSVASRVIVDLDDLEHRSLRARLLLSKDPPHMVPLQWFEYFKLRRLECSLSQLPYEFAVCSKVDKEVVGTSAKVWVVPNGIELPTQPKEPAKVIGAPVLLFLGYMAYEPNADAAQFFAKQVLPLIRRDIPEVKFLVVGKDPTSSVRLIHDGNSVLVTGTVPDVADYLRSASVVVVPIRFGGGTRIKILEAFAYRRAVVSTTKGAEGLEVQSGKHLLLADSPEDLATACKQLLRDAQLRERLGEEGFRLVQDRYQWTRIERIVSDIASDSSAPRSGAGHAASVEPHPGRTPEARWFGGPRRPGGRALPPRLQ
jgi:glycosyltransferase involved in cell wall biosynthesis